jgi:hypothetical protein
MKKKVKLLFLLPLVGSVLSSCGSTASASTGSGLYSASPYTAEQNKFSFWLPNASNGSYYSDYADNPTVRYLTKYKTWGEYNDSLATTYEIPVTGSEQATFNTMLASGELPDVLMTQAKVDMAIDMFNANITIDLTDYVNKYMPNYKNWLDTHEEDSKIAYNNSTGAKRIIEINTFGDKGLPWAGFEYRRDWILKYGANPTTNAAFKGGWTNGVWSDDIVFPNGTSDPLYISDWEWMFKIFKTAMAAENITDGYCYSPYYTGYLTIGDLVSAFGGGGPQWYKKDGTVHFGAVEEGFRTYLAALNTWYKNGWIDKRFMERTTDIFFHTNTPGVTSGKIGLWYGPVAYLGDGMIDTAQGSCVYPAMEPINDMYGSDAVKNIQPFTFYQQPNYGTTFAINKTTEKKNLPALLRMFDYLYSDQGSQLAFLGMSKEQYEETQDPVYKANGLTDGAYSWVDANGESWVEGTSTGSKLYKINPILAKNSSLNNAIIQSRMPYHGLLNKDKYFTEDAVYIKGMKDWVKYEATGDIMNYKPVTDNIPADSARTVSSITNSVNEFMSKTVPYFITGSKDVN